MAVYTAWESVFRGIYPLPIQYEQAIVVAVIGLLVNLLSAWLLHGGSGHGQEHGQGRSHGHGHHHDLNLRAAYLHVLTDALTPVLAIAALARGKAFGWDWLDPVMGLVGAAVITAWAWGLLRQTSRVLLDREMDEPVVQEIRDVIESDGEAVIADPHVWRVGPGKFACIVGVVTANPEPPEHYKERLRVHEELVHVTVEVHHSRATTRTPRNSRQHDEVNPPRTTARTARSADPWDQVARDHLADGRLEPAGCAGLPARDPLAPRVRERRGVDPRQPGARRAVRGQDSLDVLHEGQHRGYVAAPPPAQERKARRGKAGAERWDQNPAGTLASSTDSGYETRTGPGAVAYDQRRRGRSPR